MPVEIEPLRWGNLKAGVIFISKDVKNTPRKMVGNNEKGTNGVQEMNVEKRLIKKQWKVIDKNFKTFDEHTARNFNIIFNYLDEEIKGNRELYVLPENK